MACGAGSPPLNSFTNDLREDHPAVQSLRQSFKVVSLTCSNIQILQLANKFRLLSDDQILRWAEDLRPQSFSDSSSNRNSLFSVLSGSSQATTVSNVSQSRYKPTENLHVGSTQHPHDLLQRQATPLHEHADSVNQSSPISINKNAPPVHICVACNIPFTTKSSLSRHQKQHCERNMEWVCWLCVPTKNFYRKEKLCQHHIDNHGETCVPGCKQQRGGLCEKHLTRSVSELPPKKAWGCPCCLRPFDSFAAWTRHGGNHPVQNDNVVGWSLSNMVRSLILQPYLKDAIAHLPWDVCDPASVKADVCQNLREALERHKLPDAVQDHYDYRHLQLPEALAQYAFRLVAYGGPYLEDASLVRSETTATTVLEQAHTGLSGQHFSPLQRIPSTRAPGYWDPEDPFSYEQRAPQIGRHDMIPEYFHDHLLEYPDSGLQGPKQSGDAIHSPPGEMFAVPYGQNIHTRSCAPSGQPSLSQQSFAVRASQEINCVEKRGRAMSVKKSLQSLVHRPSTAKSAASHSDSVPPVRVVTDGRALEMGKTGAILDHNKDSTRYDPMDVLPISPRQARLSGRMSDVQWDLYLRWPPEEPHDP